MKFWEIFKIVQQLTSQEREALMQDVYQHLQKRHSKDDNRASRRENQASISRKSK